MEYPQYVPKGNVDAFWSVCEKVLAEFRESDKEIHLMDTPENRQLGDRVSFHSLSPEDTAIVEDFFRANIDSLPILVDEEWLVKMACVPRKVEHRIRLDVFERQPENTVESYTQRILEEKKKIAAASIEKERQKRQKQRDEKGLTIESFFHALARYHSGRFRLSFDTAYLLQCVLDTKGE